MSTPIPETDLSISMQQFPIVGIGASAGGLEAFKQFLSAVPEKSGMAYVFVQHLSPDHESSLAEILQNCTKTPVRLITNNVQLERDHIYIIPPDKLLTAVDGTLKLEPVKDKKAQLIDVFFTSLATVHQSYAVGVILSGALNDGTLGLQVIKTYGGLTFAQEPSSAAFDSMPDSAIKSGAVDFILSPDQMIPKLVAINQPFPNDYSTQEAKENSSEEDSEIFKQLLTVLRMRRGLDFTNYKPSTIKRRIIRRMALNHVEETPKYLHFLRDNKIEQDALYNDLLISVTNFFRDPQSFELLCSTIFPNLLHQKSATDPIRIWVAGCATGEEAYTMAICLQEYLGDKATARKIQIFATDVSEIAIAKARTGIYRSTDVAGLSALQLQQFFSKHDGNYHVNKSIRDMCIFAHHNLLKDPPFSKLDLISCRNVMIYLEPVLQKKALSTFQYALNEKGYLMLGKSETIGTSTDLFTSFNKQAKIYQSKGPHGKFRNVTSNRSEQDLREIDRNIQHENTGADFNKIADSILLSKYTPAGVLVNQNYDIIHFRGKTDAWLSPLPGKPSFNVLKMARDGLSFEIRSLLHLAKTKQINVKKEDVFFKLNDILHYADIEVLPLTEGEESCFLILFKKSNFPETSLKDSNNTVEHSEANMNTWIRRIEQLEKELTQTREDMRTITELQESANEELQSANEELLSGSEELRSLNEELETSKEELQSTNEEITIINNELLDRNEQLNSARKYTEEVLNTIYNPLVILDKELKVKRATDGFYQTFKVSEEETENKFLFDLGNRQWNIPELLHQLKNVLPERGSFIPFEVDHVFNSLGRRIMRLTGRQFETPTGEKLILLSIHDITEKRKVEEGLAEVEGLLEESQERMHFAVESAGIGTWDFNPLTTECIWDSRCKELYGLSQQACSDYGVFLSQVHPDDLPLLEEATRKALEGENNGQFNAEFRMINGDIPPRWIKSKGKAYFNEQNVATRFIGTVLDISLEKLLEESTTELLRKKDEFMSIASHELKTPITTIKAVLGVLDRALSGNEELKAIYPLVQRAGKQADKLTDLVKDLLDVTKLQTGNMELDKTDFSILELIKECCEQVSDKSCTVAFQAPPALRVFADRNRLEQVILNLINNAIKYSPGPAFVKIKASREKKTIKVIVSDSGIGISPEQVPHIFDRFFRVEKTTKNFAGLGLGLYISAEIVKRHQGEMGLESELGKGSSFWLIIPLK